MSGLAARVALACYPPWFRERYGQELAALVEDVGGGPRVLLDLAGGATRAWLRPALAGAPEARLRRRLQATLATTWVAWCAGISSVPLLDRLLLDPPPPGTPHAVRVLVSAAWWLALAGCAVAGAGALQLTLRVLVPARDRRLVRPLLPAALLVGVEVAGALLLGQAHRPLAGFLAGLLAWVIGLGAMVLAVAIGPVVTLRRARPAAAVMRPSILPAVAVTVLLGAVAMVDGVAAALAGRTPLTLAGVAIGVGAASCSAISVTRTLRH
ncbi:hypothetical protein [Nonomuraea roseoviolacea]|uniref:Integral membrane protein n=1 Tax=Nonomuraea roseoviolacea subsp. carminata TaxID=160689 RepID=A0ABT1KCX0_9ACTN|nr:hypothetical protein [Nonomuraea roseoviolacea]MCP2351863.1 hypothetical protein [Nonomuraea roseoviolacea subsp. carminata]